jgi:hypothetical protein
MEMLVHLWRHLRRTAPSDNGIGMVLVLGIVVFVAGVTATAGVVAINGLGQSRHRISFEQALASAESGVDFSLGKLQYAFDTAFADYPIPQAGTAPTNNCSASEVELPTQANDPASWDEEAWAEARLDALESAPMAGGRPACLMSTPTGDVLILKPRNAAGGPGLKYGRVYARGWAPGWGHPKAVERTIKAEYVFMPFQPKHAVLTGSDLSLQGSFLVDEANGVDPDTAGVHTNGNLDVDGSGGDVSGPVTFIGNVEGTTSFSSGEAAQVLTPVRIPIVSALQMYLQAPSRGSVDPSRWRDLCPDGVARVYADTGPCTGVAHPGGTGGWSFSGSSPADHLWTANRDTVDGTYFVHQANATNGSGNPDFTSITVIASATAPASPGNCPSPRYGGNIVWDHYAVGIPNFSDLWFLADQDLIVHANFDAGSNGAEPVAGTYIAGEEVELQTSSSMLVGSVLAANQCPNDSGPLADDENEVQGQQIWFKPNADSPFSSVISTTLWLEY